MEKNKTILFTDPASLGEEGYYSSTGDVDDLACIIYMSQKLEENLIVVICDDGSGQRYSSFISLIGNQLITNYNIIVIKETDFSIVPEKKNNIHIHAPISEATAQILIANIINIEHVYTQGDNQAVNFKNSEMARNFIDMVKENVLTRYDTTVTNFTLSRDIHFQKKIKVPEVSDIYNHYFVFQQRKSFGTALHLGFLCNRLYSDTGFNKGIGNGIKPFKELIGILKGEINLPPISGKLLEAFNNTVSHGGCDETAIENGKDLISLMNLYCNYENLIVDEKLPNMGNLGEINKRKDVDERVSKLFDIVPGFTSTPLFDFAAAYFAISGEIVGEDVLTQAAENSLLELNQKLYISSV